MIRMSRACIFGKYNWNIPVVAQRVVSQPNQLQKFVELSAFADKKENSVTSELKEKILEKNSKNPAPVPFQKSYHELKNVFLRDLIEGGLKRNSTPNYDTLKNLFDSLPSYPPPEIIKILKLLAITKNRPIDSIKNLCSLLCTNPDWNYTPMDCSDLLFSLARLSYRDDLLIGVISKQLKSTDKPIISSLASKILFSLAELRYRDPDLIEKLVESVLGPSISIQHSTVCLKAVSTLNYDCPAVVKLIELNSKLQEVDFIRSQDYMNFIWTCVILNKTSLISLEHISRVLSLGFVSRILSQALKNPSKWKLLNINAAARSIPSYNGPFLNDYPQFKVLNMSVRENTSMFLESVHDALTYVIPQTGYIKSLVNTGAGFNLDLEYRMSSGDPKLNKSPHRTGLLLLNYKDICSDGTLAGIPQFKLNILRSMNYKISTLKYSDFNPSDPLSKKISLLRNKIESKEKYYLTAFWIKHEA